MKLRHFVPAIVIFMTLCNSDLYAQNEKESFTDSFSSERFISPDAELPYRQAVFSQTSRPARLIVYLHGGTSKGDDNISQMNEPGIDSISRYVTANSIDAVFIVPHCPSDESWGGRLTDILKSLIEKKIETFSIKDIYIFGGSMGGTGTWTMISKYPGLFTAAMPVAGNPSKCNEANVARTPFFTVMGTEDRIMAIQDVTDFTARLDRLSAKYVFEVEDGWSHEDTCIKSYTAERLKWVFSNIKAPESAVAAINVTPYVVKTYCYTLTGYLSQHPSDGIYIIKEYLSDGSINITKRYIK